ncbi:MAG: M15 family metallopeptidase [Rectinema sp.]
MPRRASLVLLILIVLASCSEGSRKIGAQSSAGSRAGTAYAAELAALKVALSASGLPEKLSADLLARANAEPESFFSLLRTVVAARKSDSMRYARADKQVALASGYEPADLVALDGSGLSLSRAGHRIRKDAFLALKEMDAEARRSGITLTISSAYRSYSYQEGVFAKNVAEMGEAEASRVSARPGRSQHQLGTAMDFGSISDAFAETSAGRWLYANAGRFGFSLSYPKGMESVTGYVWESWHFRFIGIAAVRLQDAYFGGIQHYLLKFLENWPD